MAKELICGMELADATALHAECDGKTAYFCSEHCRAKFPSGPVGVKLEAITERTQ